MKFIIPFFIVFCFSVVAQVPDTNSIHRVTPPPPIDIRLTEYIQPVKVYKNPDVKAKFKGGKRKFKNYLDGNLVYPKDAGYLKQELSVYFSFIIEMDGSVTNVKIDRKSIDRNFDDEARRFMKNMPNWKPAKSEGEPVRSRNYLTIVFDAVE